MMTETSLRASISSAWAASDRATAPLIALRASGRLMVRTATPSSTVLKTTSAMATSLGRGRGRVTPEADAARRRPARAAPSVTLYLLGLEPDAAVEPDDLGVHIVVVDQGEGQLGELGAGAHALREHHRRGQLGLELLGLRREAVDRGVDDAGADGQHPDPDGGQVPRGGHGHADDAALGGRVGDLAGLALDARHRGSVDDYAALAIRVRGRGLGDGRRADPHQVERADQVDVDDLAVGGEVVR